MRVLVSSCAVVSALVFAAAARPANQVDCIDALIVHLGSSKYQSRQAAMLALDIHGEAALPALRIALKNADPEVRQRAALLIKKIEHRVESGRAVAGTKMRLVYKDVPLLDAIRDVSAKSGIHFEIQTDTKDLVNRRITLDTGETSFWEAFELFCRQSGLCDQIDQAPPATGDALRSQPSSGLVIPLLPPFGGGLDAPQLDRIASPLMIKNGAPVIGLTETKSPPLPTVSVGGIRLRAVLHDAPAKQGGPAWNWPPPEHIGFLLEVTPEPKIAWHSLVSLWITDAIDDKGQKLIQPTPYFLERVNDPLFGIDGIGIGIWTDETSLGINEKAAYRHLVGRLGPGKEPTKLLKEVRGIASVQILANQPLVTVPNVMAAVGQECIGPSGMILQVEAVKREGHGEGKHLTISAKVSQKTAAAWQRQGVVVRANAVGDLHVEPGLGQTSFTMTNPEGKQVLPVHCEHIPTPNRIGAASLWAAYKLKFRIADSATEPGPLCYKGMRPITVDIPFVLRDVPVCDDPAPPLPRWGYSNYRSN